jgi:NAD-dependent deacetylase
LTFPDHVINKLATAQRVAVLTGAGISAESGVPTFRGKDGLWGKFKAEELANPDAFLRNPQLVWEWYEFRRKIIRSVQPNPAHLTLVEMEKYFPHFLLCTQNVDNLHFKAGNRNICELHGNILKNKCCGCGKTFGDLELLPDSSVPRCACGDLIRPDVVWFGEMLPVDAIELASFEAEHADVLLSIGTSSVVYPAAMLPIQAKKSGAFVIEINLQRTAISHQVHASIQGKSGEILPALWSAVLAKKETSN